MGCIPKLYYMPESGPCRTVMMAVKVLEVDLNFIHLDLRKGEQRTPEYLKLNPLHQIPTLIDEDLVLTESRSIITYLCEKFSKNDSLYPKDVQKRAKINQRLYFDISTLYQPIVSCYSVVYLGSKSFDESKIPDIKKAFDILNMYLAKNKFVADNSLTIADIAIVSSVGTCIAVLDFDLQPYPNVQHWFNILKTSLPDYEKIMVENEKKLRKLVDYFKSQH